MEWVNTQNRDAGLIKTYPDVRPKIKKPMNPLLREMIKKFTGAADQRELVKHNKKLEELYSRIPGLDEKITDQVKRLVKAAAEVELGDLKRGSYEKLEEDLKKVKTDKIIILTAIQELLERQQAEKKDSIRSVGKIAREEYTPVIQGWDRILEKVEELQTLERRIRTAFTVATGLPDGRQYGWLPGVPRVNVSPRMWRQDVKRYLK